jgi:hypothetical protein
MMNAFTYFLLCVGIFAAGAWLNTKYFPYDDSRKTKTQKH